MHDLLIVGAGPSGLATALYAARRGMDVAVVDPHAGTVDKACGEGLMPAAVELLANLGVHPTVYRPFVGIRYVHEGRQADGHLSAPGWGIRRTVLHQALDHATAEAGVARVVARVGGLAQGEDHVEAAGLRARWLIAADGLHSPIRRQLGLSVPTSWPRRYGLRQHFRVAPWSDHVEVHWADDAEAYVTPVSDDTIGIAMLFGEEARQADEGRPGTPFQRLLRRFPVLAEQATEPASHPRGAGPFAQGVRARRAGRVLLVGDAAGYLDPITGEGIKLGLQAGHAAVDTILAGRPQDYEARWRALYRRYVWATGGLLLLTRTRCMRRRLVPLLQRLPRVFDRVLEVIAR